MLAVALTPSSRSAAGCAIAGTCRPCDKLDDRMLRDIGLIRSALQNVAWANAR